jgi:hypothetical protein
LSAQRDQGRSWCLSERNVRVRPAGPGPAIPGRRRRWVRRLKGVRRPGRHADRGWPGCNPVRRMDTARARRDDRRGAGQTDRPEGTRSQLPRRSRQHRPVVTACTNLPGEQLDGPRGLALRVRHAVGHISPMYSSRLVTVRSVGSGSAIHAGLYCAAELQPASACRRIRHHAELAEIDLHLLCGAREYAASSPTTQRCRWSCGCDRLTESA